MAHLDKIIQSKWSDERRLYLIAIIVDKILSQDDFDLSNIISDLQRILALADKSNEFLEANKDEMGENNET